VSVLIVAHVACFGSKPAGFGQVGVNGLAHLGVELGKGEGVHFFELTIYE
jgi:hypothetical protein